MDQQETWLVQVCWRYHKYMLHRPSLFSCFISAFAFVFLQSIVVMLVSLSVISSFLSFSCFSLSFLLDVSFPPLANFVQEFVNEFVKGFLIKIVAKLNIAKPSRTNQTMPAQPNPDQPGTDHTRPHQTTSDDTRQHRTTPHDTRRQQTTPDHFIKFHTTPNDGRRPQTTSEDTRRHQTTPEETIKLSAR